jgi:hypothetical protein
LAEIFKKVPMQILRASKVISHREETAFGAGTKYAINVRGVYQVDKNNKQLQFLGARRDSLPAFSEDGLRKKAGIQQIFSSALLGMKNGYNRLALNQVESSTA